MHKIYFADKCTVICSPEERIETAESSETVVLSYADPETAYYQACSRFREVNAGGGLVTNDAGEFLFIRRNGIWDLPKGHQEAGEDISRTARREVWEETGVENADMGELICVTDHCYIYEGEWRLKHTWWYSMKWKGGDELKPMYEENITGLAWVHPKDLAPYLENTFPSIREVLDHISATRIQE